MLKVTESFGISFKDKKLQELAFVHSSYANEHNIQSNERLEFLGDSVLGLIVSEYLYRHKNVTEGKLSKFKASIVKSGSLISAIDKTCLFDSIKLGSSFKNRKSDELGSIKEDLFESLVGAIYLDGGISAAREFVTNMLDFDELCEIDDDYKTQLQEFVQGLGGKVEYVTSESENGFESNVMINGNKIFSGVGTTKKEAERVAAKTALLVLRT